MPNYGDPKYWDRRYKAHPGSTFDWLVDYQTLKPLLQNIMTKDSNILMIGCGNSTLGEDMYKDGYHSIYNIDISSVVIRQMMDRTSNCQGMVWEAMDATDLKYDDCFFDVALDKATIDTLLCGENPALRVAKMLKEV